MSSVQTTLSLAQWNVCVSILKRLKRMPETREFRKPVDPVRWNIPDYYQVVRQPMDLSTIERKLNLSNPSAYWVTINSQFDRYLSAEDFEYDIRLIFTNCAMYNGEGHELTLVGKQVEAVFDRLLAKMPGPQEVSIRSHKSGIVLKRPVFSPYVPSDPLLLYTGVPRTCPKRPSRARSSHWRPESRS